MPEQTTNPSPSNTFALSAFGAVSFVKKSTVHIPDDIRAALAEVPAMLATMPNTLKIHLDLRAKNPNATEEDAATFRAQIKAYAEEHGDLNAYLPVFVDGHWSRKDADKDPSWMVTETDPETGKPIAGTIAGSDGKAIPVKWIAPNGVDPTWNTGHDITFRLTYKKSDDDTSDAGASASRNGAVTVTQGTPRPVRPKSRGAQILGR